MISQLLEENKVKAKISVNCFLALGAFLRYKMTPVGQEDDYGIDVLLWHQVDRDGHIRDLSPVLHFQIKSTENYRIVGDEIVYQLENKTLNDVITRNINQSTPLIVILLILPSEEGIDWMRIDHNDIRIMKSLYWYHSDSTTLKVNEDSKTTIRIPIAQNVNTGSLKSLIEKFAVQRV